MIETLVIVGFLILLAVGVAILILWTEAEFRYDCMRCEWSSGYVSNLRKLRTMVKAHKRFYHKEY